MLLCAYDCVFLLGQIVTAILLVVIVVYRPFVDVYVKAKHELLLKNLRKLYYERELMKAQKPLTSETKDNVKTNTAAITLHLDNIKTTADLTRPRRTKINYIMDIDGTLIECHAGLSVKGLSEKELRKHVVANYCNTMQDPADEKIITSAIKMLQTTGAIAPVEAYAIATMIEMIETTRDSKTIKQLHFYLAEVKNMYERFLPNTGNLSLVREYFNDMELHALSVESYTTLIEFISNTLGEEMMNQCIVDALLLDDKYYRTLHLPMLDGVAQSGLLTKKVRNIVELFSTLSIVNVIMEERENLLPFYDMLAKKIEKLFAAGHIVSIFTSSPYAFLFCGLLGIPEELGVGIFDLNKSILKELPDGAAIKLVSKKTADGYNKFEKIISLVTSSNFSHQLIDDTIENSITAMIKVKPWIGSVGTDKIPHGRSDLLRVGTPAANKIMWFLENARESLKGHIPYFKM